MNQSSSNRFITFYLNFDYFQTKAQPKLSKFTSKQISYSSVLQSLLNNPNVRVKIADLGNACFDVSRDFWKDFAVSWTSWLFEALSLYRWYPNTSISFNRSVAGCSIHLFSWYLEHGMFSFWISNRRLPFWPALRRKLFKGWRSLGAYNWIARNNSDESDYERQAWAEVFH